MYTKQDYITAVEEFNSLKSFNIVLPRDNDMFKTLAKKFTKQIREYKDNLETYEHFRKNGFVDNNISTDICSFVVHVNQITNNIKDIDEPIVSFE